MKKLAFVAVLVVLLAGCSFGRGGSQPAAEPAPTSTPPAPSRMAFKPAARLAVSPTGDWIASGPGLTLTDRTGKSTQVYAGDQQLLNLAWAPNGEKLLAHLAGGKLLLVTPTDGKVTDLSAQVKGLPDDAMLMAWAPDGGGVLMTLYQSNDVHPIWQITPATGEVREVKQISRVARLLWPAVGGPVIGLAAGSGGAQMARLDLATGALKDEGFKSGYILSPDGKHLAESNYMGGQVTKTDLVTGKQEQSMRDFVPWDSRPGVEIKGEYRFNVVSWSPDSTTLAYSLEAKNPDITMLHLVGAKEMAVKDWAGGLTWLGTGHDLMYTTHAEDGLAVNLNGSVLATYPGALGLWLPGSAPLTAVRSPDGRRLAYTVLFPGNKSALFVVDLATGKAEPVPDSNGLAPLTFSPAGDKLVVGRHEFTRQDLGGGSYSEWWEFKETTTLPVSAGPAPAAAAKPFWGPPGTTVWAGDTVLSRSFAPLTLKGRTVYPVFTGTDTFFFRQEGDALYLDGRVIHAGSIELFDQPQLLYKLPTTAGTVFNLVWEHHNFGVGPNPFRIAGFETVKTKAGSFDTVKLEAERMGGGVWAPGVGRVRGGEGDATRVETGKPMPLPAIAKLNDQTTAYLVGGLEIWDQSGKVLMHEDMNWIRGRAWWGDAGGPNPIALYYVHTQAEPNLTFRGFAYRPDTGKFEPVRWRLPDGRVKDRVAGEITQGDGVLNLQDHEHYPTESSCAFRWNGTELACTAYTGGFYAKEERNLIFTLSRALDEESWASIFLDPAEGRKAYQATRVNDGRNRLAFHAPAKPEPDGSWSFPEGFSFTLVQQDGQWRVATWKHP